MPLMIAQTKQYANVKLVLAASHSKAPMMVIVMFLQIMMMLMAAIAVFKMIIR